MRRKPRIGPNPSPARAAAATAARQSGSTPSWFAAIENRLLACHERDRVGLDFGESAAERDDCLPLRHTADVDAGDMRPLGELLGRAGEREPEQESDQHEEARDDGERRVCRPGPTPPARARRVERRIGAHRGPHCTSLASRR